MQQLQDLSSWFNWFIMESCNSICLSKYSHKKGDEEENIDMNLDKKQIVIETINTNHQDLNIINSASEEKINSTPSIIKSQLQSYLYNKHQLSTNMTNTRPFDVIIFGASSSVGNFLIEEMALVIQKYYNNNNNNNHLNQQQIITSTLGLKEFRDPIELEVQQATKTSYSEKRFSVPRHMNDGFRWAIAGRSAIKLQESLCKAELSTGIKDLSNRIPVILADLQQHKSLIDMCSKTNLVFNCAGPYSIDGEAIIKACLYCKTNYLDLSHEIKFINRIRKLYHNRAKQAGIYIINGCGFQSMSAELGLNFIKQIVDGQIDHVEIILNLSDTSAIIKPNSNHLKSKSLGLISWGMWNSFLIDKAQLDYYENHDYEKEQKNLLNKKQSTTTIADITNHSNEDDYYCEDEKQKQLEEFHRKQLLRKDTQTLVNDLMELKNKKSFSLYQLIRGFAGCPTSGYCLPINNITSEQAQLIRGEMTNYQERDLDLNKDGGAISCWKPIRSSSFISVKSLIVTLFALIWLIIFNTMVKFSFLRRLMKIFPSIISLGNVTNKNNSRILDRDSLNHIKFSQTFLVYGTPGDDSGDPLEQRERNVKRKEEQLLVARIVGPEPNHVTTATLAIQACLALILERDHLPASGGVLTPGTAFAETNIIYQLRRRNIKFEVLKKA